MIGSNRDGGAPDWVIEKLKGINNRMTIAREFLEQAQQPRRTEAERCILINSALAALKAE